MKENTYIINNLWLDKTNEVKATNAKIACKLLIKELVENHLTDIGEYGIYKLKRCKSI